MFGAFLLAGPRTARNRSLFVELTRYMQPPAEEDTDIALVYSVAINNTGDRLKVSGFCRPYPFPDMETVLNPFNEEKARLRVFSNYYVPLVDQVTDEVLAPDILTVGTTRSVSIPTRGMGVFVSCSDVETMERLVETVPSMVADADATVSLVDKLDRHFLPKLREGTTAQIVISGHSPSVCLLRNGLPLHTYIMACFGNLYFVWSSRAIRPELPDVTVWPLAIFEDETHPRQILGMPLLAIRSRWATRNINKTNSSSPQPQDPGRLAYSLSYLHTWLHNRSRGYTS